LPALARFTRIADPRSGLLAAQALTRGLVGVTIGADGFLWLQAGDIRHAPSPAVAVVDTVGAGDVFHGAFALAIARGGDTAQAARFANTAAALKCTKAGGRAGIPSLSDVQHALG
jgi:sulfofructose kinase